MEIFKIFRYTSLIKYLTWREISTRYKQSFLGFFWVVLNPLFQMLIMSFVFSHIMRFNTISVPYPIFLYVGLLPWIFFINTLNHAANVIVSDSALIKKIYFPREILVISSLLAKTFDFFVSGIVFLILLFFFHVPLTVYALFFFVIFIIQFIFTFALSLFLSWTNLFYRDIQYLLSLILTLWFYLTPIIYPVEFFPEKYRFIFKLNPMSVFINAYRQVLLGGDFPRFESLAIGIAISLIAFLVSYSIFKKVEKTLADVV
jgi:ABC-type polysaccharide/polyol phosphate export permease